VQRKHLWGRVSGEKVVKLEHGPCCRLLNMHHLTRDGQATAAGAYALSVTANEGESNNRSHSLAV